MSRQVRDEMLEIPAHVKPVKCETRACDRCGAAISLAEWDGQYAHELLLYLDAGECVSYWFRRDYCPGCLGPVWQAICQLIGADPDDHSHSDFDDAG